MHKSYLQMTPQEKRQAVLDLLNQHGGMVFCEIKRRMDATQSLSSVLNIMSRRGEIAKGRRVNGNQFTWIATTTQATPVSYGPQPDHERTNHVPGLRTVRLLDKPASQTGRCGQCAGTDYGSLQCNFNERSMVG